MLPDRAAAIGLDAVAFLAGLPDRFEGFLAVSGLDASTLRARLADNELLGAVLDFLLTDDTLVLDFCRERELQTRDIHIARRILEEH